MLCFYPKDMTQGCTIEAHNFQRDLAQYEAKKAAILGVSADTISRDLKDIFRSSENVAARGHDTLGRKKSTGRPNSICSLIFRPPSTAPTNLARIKPRTVEAAWNMMPINY